MKKKFVLPLILGIGLMLLIFWGIDWYQTQKKDPYATFIKPRMELANFQIKTLNRQKTEMDMNMLIDNPMPVGFEIDSLEYEIFIAETEVMQSTYPETLKMKGNDSSMISMPVTVDNEKLIERLKELEEKNIDSIDYKIEGRFFTNIPFLKDKPIDFEAEKRLPLFRIPKAEFKKLKIEKFGLNETKLIIEAEIENPNIFPFKFKQTSFNVKIDKDELMKGKIDTAVNIPAKGKVVLNLPAEVSLKEMGETVFQMITKPKEVDYSFNMDTKLISDDNTLKDSQIRMEGKGKLKELTKKDK